MKVPGKYGVIYTATGLIAVGVCDKPFKANNLSAAKVKVLKDRTVDTTGTEVVPLTYALELAYKGVIPSTVKKVKFVKGKVFERFVRIVAGAEPFDAVSISMYSHNTEGVFVQLSTALPRLSHFHNDGLITKLPKTKSYKVATLEDDYPLKTYWRKPGGPPVVEATQFTRSAMFPAWLAMFERWLEVTS